MRCQYPVGREQGGGLAAASEAVMTLEDSYDRF
jgi:hypothetical protein